MPPKHTSGSAQAGKTNQLSRTEIIAQLARRRAAVTAQATQRRRRDAGDNAPSLPRTGVPAALHKFHVGQTVTLVPTRYGSNRLGRFSVTALLPQEHTINHYRLKSTLNGHERIANEDELVSDLEASPATPE